MKILQINNVYKSGSTGKITYNIHSGLQKFGYDAVVCYGRGKRIRDANVYKICSELSAKWNNLYSRITGMMYGGCRLSTYRLKEIIQNEKPDIVHIQCINGFFVNIYKLIAWLKVNRVKTVLTLHAEFMYTANCGHALDCDKWKTGCGHCPRLRKETHSWFFDQTHRSWLKMKAAFDGFDDNLSVVSVSPWLKERAEQSPILRGKRHYVVLNGLDTEIFHPYGNTIELREKHGLTNEKIIFHATPDFDDNIDHLKGGYYVIKLAEMLRGANVKFIVAGKHREGLKVPENIILLGQIEDQILLAKYYSMANVTLLTSKRETFSMVTAESLCCGTPVIGFKAGAPEQIAIPEYSRFVDFGNLDELYNMVKSTLNTFFSVDIAKAQAKYSFSVMLNNYINIYNNLIQGI